VIDRRDGEKVWEMLVRGAKTYRGVEKRIKPIGRREEKQMSPLTPVYVTV